MRNGSQKGECNIARVNSAWQSKLAAASHGRDDLPVKLWSWKKENLPTIRNGIRTSVAAMLSVLVARLLGMPEAYWAAVSTLVVIQSTLSTTLPLAIQRIVASALGASVGAIEATYFGHNLAAFGLAIFVLGLAFLAFRLEKTGYRYAGITLTIIVLIPRADAPWMIATHRFIEVSIGILVALALAAIWREEEALPVKTQAE